MILFPLFRLSLAFASIFMLLYLAGARPPLFGAFSVAEPFEDYEETIPGTVVTFEMKAIPGGLLKVGEDEIEVAPFWMARTEVTWDEYEEFYFGGVPDGLEPGREEAVDAVSRPTPPYGAPDQGWGAGTRPAMSMSFHAAQTYCEWLSALTGKEYRLPTEAEWEYACRAGSQNWSPEGLGKYAWHAGNSNARSQEVRTREPNPLGLFDMLGNVAEFVWNLEALEGKERTWRGGSYLDQPGEISCATRVYSAEDPCLVTDPQIPKSIWWYSDCFHIGFRVVRSAP